jgi:hypothetical protein
MTASGLSGGQDARECRLSHEERPAMTADPIPDQARAPMADDRPSPEALSRTAHEHLADLLFALADLKTQAVRAEAPALAHRLDALIAAIAAAEAACLPGPAPDPTRLH